MLRDSQSCGRLVTLPPCHLVTLSPCHLGILLLCLVAGCETTQEERARNYNQDGVQLFKGGSYGPACESFQAALTLKPEDADLLYNIAECHAHQGDAARAERYYNECLQKSPNHVACRFALAALLVRNGRLPEAARMANDWLAREPKRADPYALDGFLWHQAGDLPRAQGRLQQALVLDPQNVRALTELALIYEAMQRPDRAVVLYERILVREPNNNDIIRRLNELQAKGTGRPRPE
ncbi:MAG: tetratricopeptide repeat protein [Gemmataceae bacterium]|nr:tetratricopeptide repeat protein [Gemmataceae bacterium]